MHGVHGPGRTHETAGRTPPKRRGRANNRGDGVILTWTLAVVITLSSHTTHHRHLRFAVPAPFYRQALCVHDGWHYRRVWGRGRAAYVFGRVRFARTWKTWSNGEGAWNDAGYYGGGMQFLVSTWNSVGGHARTTADIGRATPREQIFRAWLVVRRDGGWSEWGGTKTACGLD